MAPITTGQRVSGWTLALAPFLAIALVSVRSLRTPGLHQAIGAGVFLVLCAAGWRLIAPALRDTDRRLRMRLAAGALLLVPFALIALLWVGLSTPWAATPDENVLRYLVLLAGAVAVTAGMVALHEALREDSGGVCSTLALSAAIMAGGAYLVWLAFQIGEWSDRVRTGQAPEQAILLNDALDTLLFVACALTYCASTGFALAMGRARWLGRRQAAVYAALSLGALVLLAIRGLSFPDAAAGSTPWHAIPGFIAGIPAVPWILPHLLGVAALRCAAEAAGDQMRPTTP